MENYKITKEQILAIEKVGGADVSLYLKETFPEVFKTELEVGKWYKMKGDTHFLCNFNGNIGNNGNSYGFNLKGEWMDNSMCFHNSDTYVEATPEEVETALVNEAKKRGFEVGVKFENMNNKFIQTIISKPYFSEISNTLHVKSPKEDWDKGNSNPCIFNNGTWAEILQTPNDVIKVIETYGKDKLITLIEAYNGKN